MKILYVEDSITDADLTCRALAKTAPNLNVEVVDTYQAAVSRLEQVTDYDLVLTDLNLPDGDGLSLLAHIRKHYPALAIILITGGGDEETAVAALRAGADDYIIKGEDYLANLPILLEDTLDRHRAEKARHARPLHILYAEHTPEDVDLTRRHLAKHAPHITLEAVPTAQELHRRISAKEQSRPDALLLDYYLPDRNALELLKELRHTPWANIPVVIVTGHGNEEIATQTIKLGAANYLVKTNGYLYRLPIVLENAIHQTQLAHEQSALRESEERFSKAFHASPIPVCITTLAEGRFIDANESYLHISEFRREDIIGHTAEELNLWITPDKRRELVQQLQAKKSLHGIEHKFLTSTGKTRDTLAAYELINLGGEACILSIFYDITERKRIEAALRESEERYRSLVELSPYAIITHSEGKITFANAAAAKLLKAAAPEELIGMPILDFVHPDYRDLVAERVAQAKQGKTAPKVEEKFVRLDGTTIDVEVVAMPFSHQGKSGSLVIARNITERKQAEEAIRASETSYRGLFNSVLEAIYIQDHQGRFLDVNEGAVKMYGYPHKFFIGKTPADLSAPGLNDMQKIQRAFERAFNGEPQQFEFWGLRKNGEIFPKDVRIYKGTYFGEEVVIALAQDITERKKNEDALQRQLKELSILHAVAVAGTQAANEDELITYITQIIGDTLYPDHFGVLLLDEAREILSPHASYHGINVEEAPSISLQTGISGKVVRDKRPIRIGDTRKEKNYLEVTPETRSELCVPLKVGKKIIGVINTESKQVDFFTEADERLLNTIAGQVATAIEQLRLFEAEKQRRLVAETLRETALAVTSSLNLEQAIQQILEQLSLVLPYDSACVQILGDGYLENIGGRGWPHPEQALGVRYPIPGDNPNTTVIQERREVILDHAPDQHAPFRSPPNDYIQSWLGVPLIIHDKVIGMLAVDSMQPKYFTEESAKLANAFATQAAIAIENAQLFDAEQRRRREAETLRQVARAVSSSLELDQVLDAILTSLKQVVPYDSSSIFLLEGDQLRLTTLRGFAHPEKYLDATFSADDTLFKAVRESKTPLILPDAQMDARFKKWGDVNNARGWMGIPLIARGTVIGCITLDSLQENAYDEHDAALAQAFVHQAAAAIENAHLYQDALRAAERRAILHRVSQDIVRASQDPEQTYTAIHEAASQLMPCNAFVISLRDETRGDDEAVYLVEDGKRFPAQRIPREHSLASPVIRSKKTLIIDDVETVDQSKFTQFGEQHKVRALLAAPMRIGDKITGIISTQCYQPHVYGDEERILLEMLASHAAVAIENARLFAETQRRAREFTELYEVTQDLSGPQDLGALLETIVQRAVALLGTAFGSIYLYDETVDELELVVSYGFPSEYTHPLGIRLKRGEGMAGRVAETRQPLSVEDYQEWEGRSPQYDKVPFSSVLEVPMLYAGKLVGVLTVNEHIPKIRQFTDADIHLLTLFATQAAGAVHSARLHKQTRRRLSDLEAINRVSTALRTAQTPEEMFTILLDETLNVLGTDVGGIWLYDPASNEVVRTIARGWVTEFPEKRHKPGEGLSGYVFETDEIYITPDYTLEEHISSNRELIPPGWGGVGIPIRTTHTTIGVFIISIPHPRQFTNEEIDLLVTLAEMAGNAIQRATLHERTELQVKRLIALRNIDIAISSSFDLRVTLNLLVDHTITQLGADAADVLLFSPPTQTLTYAAGYGFRTTSFSQTRLRAGEGLAGKAILERKLVHVANMSEDPQCVRKHWFIDEGFVSYFCVPLSAKGQIVGALEVYNRSPLAPSSQWLDFLQTLGGQAAIAINNDQLFEDLQRSHQDLALAYDTTLEGWAKALELRDKEIKGHAQRVAKKTIRLAHEMEIEGEALTHIRRGTLLHDIGKMGIPDNILHKPGPLTDEEKEIMHQHPQYAYDLLYPIPYLRPALDIPYCHHEKWDGSGYPRGLKGEEIPLAARIFAIIDVWDALLSNRSYRKAWSRKKTLDYIKKESGRRFDPKVVEAFLRIIKEM
ncbi:MAG: GAF domain-containing protein [Chloroflexi bacterium]|nr:GAF domain-containing protein [Chloroflexota bacterium]